MRGDRLELGTEKQLLHSPHIAMDNDDDNDDDAHNAVATVLGSQFGRERKNGQRIRPAIHVD